MLTKKDVQMQLDQMVQQEKQMWANLNYLMGQQSVLKTLLDTLPDEPETVNEAPPDMVKDHCELVGDVPEGVIPITRKPKGK